MVIERLGQNNRACSYIFSRTLLTAFIACWRHSQYFCWKTATSSLRTFKALSQSSFLWWRYPHSSSNSRHTPVASLETFLHHFFHQQGNTSSCLAEHPKQMVYHNDRPLSIKAKSINIHPKFIQFLLSIWIFPLKSFTYVPQLISFLWKLVGVQNIILTSSFNRNKGPDPEQSTRSTWKHIVSFGIVYVL